MARGKSKKKITSTNWLDTAIEVPRDNAPSNRDRSKRQRFYRRFIVAAVILLPVSLGTNMLILGSIVNRPTVQSSPDQVDPATRAVATLAVQNWLNTPISPVPGVGQIISWDGATVQEKPVQTAQQAQQNQLPKYDIEIHTFTIADSFGSTYVASIQVAVDPLAGALAFGTPSLLPVAAVNASAFSTANPWIGLSTSSAPETVVGAVVAWANAFTSGDADALRLAVQDENGQHSYVPLFNVIDHTVVVTRGAYLPEPGADPGAPVVKSTRMVVQIQLLVQWAGAKSPTSSDKLPVITYDLLVEKVSGGAPVVVAWGSPGAGNTFTAYQNALSGRAILTTPPITVFPSPTETPEPSKEPTPVTDGTDTD